MSMKARTQGWFPCVRAFILTLDSLKRYKKGKKKKKLMFIVLIYQITFGKLLHWFSLALNEYLSVVPPSVDSLKQLFNIACDIHS